MKIKRNSLYLIAYALYVFIEVITASTYTSIIPKLVFTLARLFCILILICLYFTEKKSFKEMLLVLFMLIFGVIVFTRAGNLGINFICILLFIVTAKKIDFMKLLKYDMVALVIGWAVVTLSSFAGITDDRIYIHALIDTIAHTHGFNYYSYPTMLIFTCSIIYLILKPNKKPFIKYAIIILINYLASRIYTTRIYIIALVLFIVWHASVHIFKRINLKNKIWSLIAKTGFYLCYAANYLFYKMYDPSNSIYSFLNKLSSNRILLGKKGIDDYGINLLGQKITMHGVAEKVYGDVVSEANYIDSGYLYSLLCYGTIFCIIIALCYTLAFKVIINKEEKELYGWMLLFMILNIPNNYILSIAINPLLLLSMSYMKNTINKTDRNDREIPSDYERTIRETESCRCLKKV